MRSRAAGLGIGVVFGIVLCWSGLSNPDVIRGALLFEDGYLFLFFGSAVITAVIGLQVLRRVRTRAVLGGGPLAWVPESPQRRHVTGAAMFGVGWGVANACPGPILAQVGQGMGWGAITLAGVIAGVHIFLREKSVETEPPADTSAARADAALADTR